MTDPPLRKCKVCGARGRVSRLVGAGAGLIFKGSGFYETDYKRIGTSGAEGEKKPDTGEKATKETAEKSKDKKEKPKTANSKSSSPSSSKGRISRS